MLVEQARKTVLEISNVRKEYSHGSIGGEQAKVWVGLFNATARIINAAINAEKFGRVCASKK
jgi:hypothetical protein